MASTMLGYPKRVIRQLARSIAGTEPVAPPAEIDLYPHRFDLMATRHNDGFRDDPVFVAAYARAVQASGWDYGTPWRIHQLLWCAGQARKVEGDVVELGTGRGFFMSAMLAAWPGWSESARSLHLFDTFDPRLVQDDGTRGAESPFYARSLEETRRNFAEWPRVRLYGGDVFETLPAAPVERVAFLHVDLNHKDPETFSLRLLWDRLPRGGIVLLDDYAYYTCEAQYEAMNALAAELGFAILSTPTGQGIVVK